ASTPTPTPKAIATPKPTATAKATPTPKATPIPKATPTPKAAAPVSKPMPAPVACGTGKSGSDKASDKDAEDTDKDSEDSSKDDDSSDVKNAAAVICPVAGGAPAPVALPVPGSGAAGVTASNPPAATRAVATPKTGAEVPLGGGLLLAGLGIGALGAGRRLRGINGR
ncbi:MAG: hypothetical protein JWM18_2972, partial [Chloroflexi bacterium]|nr:hypothetical protein [Chloroflexota bacterium]